MIKNLTLSEVNPSCDQAIWRKTSKILPDCPSELYPLVVIWDDLEDCDKTLFLTYLRCYKQIEIPSPKDFSTITLEQSDEEKKFTSDLCDKISGEKGLLFLKRNKTFSILHLSKSKFLISDPNLLIKLINPGLIRGSFWTKNGPNGNTLWSRVVDIINLSEKKEFVSKLDNLVNLYYDLGFEGRGSNFNLSLPSSLLIRYQDRLDFFKDILIKIKPNLQESFNLLITSKLRCFQEGGGKWRYIALRDWITQSCLYPLHKLIFRNLRNHPCDCTFDQNKVQRKIKEWQTRKGIFSVDLRRATDRLPLQLQISILSILRNNEIGEVWGSIIKELTFFYIEKGNNPKPFKYAVGQGIGVYSSWAILAITNHFLVVYSAYLLGYKDFKEYLVLGDDVVIANPQVGEKYIDILTKLGVKVSLAKTIKSLNQPYGCEFASQLLKGEKVFSPLPMGLVKEGSVESLFSLWSHLKWRKTLYVNAPWLATSLDLGPAFPISGKANLQTQWGLVILYQQWYKKTKLYHGCPHLSFSYTELLSRELITLLESIPLEFFLRVEKQYTYYLRKKVILSADCIFKNSYSLGYVKDSLPIKKSIFEEVSKVVKQPSWTYHYDSLTRLFCSPYIRNLDLAIDISSEILDKIPSYKLRILAHKQDDYLDPFKLLNHIRNTPLMELPINVSEDKFIELIRLRIGPTLLFDPTRYKGVNPIYREGLKSGVSRQTVKFGRISSYRVKQLTRGYYLRQAIKKMLGPVGKKT